MASCREDRTSLSIYLYLSIYLSLSLSLSCTQNELRCDTQVPMEEKHSTVSDKLKEIRTLMRTRHSRLVMFFGFGTTIGPSGNRSTMIVMEYLQGRDLSKRIWRHSCSSFKTPSWVQRIQWLEDVAEALSYLHYVRLLRITPNSLKQLAQINTYTHTGTQSHTSRCQITQRSLNI